MSTKADYRTAIEDLVPEQPFSGTDEMDRAISRAMNTHSRHKPQMVAEDIAGADTHEYVLTGTLADWEDGFSKINRIEYPVDDDDEDKDYLEESDWAIYKKTDDKYYLHFLSDTPATGETIRVWYTARHTCTNAACTVEAPDEEPAMSLAAAYFCRIIAAKYAQSQDSTILADNVDHASKRREFEAQAKSYMQEYYDHMGIKEGRPKPANVVQDQDVDYPSGWDRLTHPRRRR